MIADVLAALITYFGTVSDLTALVSTRIYVGMLPEWEVENMPQKVVVIRPVGGTVRFRSDPLQRPRVDIFSYGEGYLEAGKVDRAVADALHDLRRETASNVLLHAAGYGGASAMKDPDTGWTYMLRTAIITADEREAS